MVSHNCGFLTANFGIIEVSHITGVIEAGKPVCITAVGISGKENAVIGAIPIAGSNSTFLDPSGIAFILLAEGNNEVIPSCDRGRGRSRFKSDSSFYQIDRIIGAGGFHSIIADHLVDTFQVGSRKLVNGSRSGQEAVFLFGTQQVNIFIRSAASSRASGDDDGRDISDFRNIFTARYTIAFINIQDQEKSF